MSDTDKTRRMLMNSIAKTRAGVHTNPVPAEPASPKPTTRKKTVRKKSSMEKASAQKALINKSMARLQPVIDSYQSKGRIWPD